MLASACRRGPATVQHHRRRKKRRGREQLARLGRTNTGSRIDAQRILARTERHRAVGIADLLTAALAAEYGMTVLHYEPDFEISDRSPTFAHRWVLPRKSV
jgi:predicted nucleic acid-binding protein